MAGFILSRVAADEAEILTIAVAPEWRRRGIATSLLKPHMHGLSANRVSRLFLEVDVENTAARALYANFGFRAGWGAAKPIIERRAPSLATALVMRRDLL